MAKLLIVEDDDAILRFLSILLEGRGIPFRRQKRGQRH